MEVSRGSYNKNNTYGLGNALLNYIISNNLFEKDINDISIVKKDCLCLLQDDKTVLNYGNLPELVFEITLRGEDDKTETRKFATLPKVIEFLRNMNTLFENGIGRIDIRKEKGAEIL